MPVNTSIAESRWRYYPLDGLARVVLMLAISLGWMLVGLLGLAGLSVVAGLLVEEGLVPVGEVATSTDLVGRASLAALLILGPIILLAWALLFGLTGPLTGRSLARHARNGADPADVPAREQWELAVEDSAGTLRFVSIALIVVLGLGLLIVLFTVPEWDAQNALIVGAALAVFAVPWGTLWLGKKAIPAWQSRYRERIGEHWTTPHRVIADGRELTEEDEPGPDETVPGRTAHRLEQACLSVLGVSAFVGLGALQLVFSLAYPDREDWPGGSAGERAELDPLGESAVDMLTLAFAASAVVGLLALALAGVCEGVARSQIHRMVSRALVDDDVPRPRLPLLRTIVSGNQPPFLRALGILAGAVVGFGFSLWFVASRAGASDWEYYHSAAQSLLAAARSGPWIMLAGIGLLALVVAVGVLLDARDRQLRDRIVQRWPVRHIPKEKDE